MSCSAAPCDVTIQGCIYVCALAFNSTSFLLDGEAAELVLDRY
jgi:hypothetical protein